MLLLSTFRTASASQEYPGGQEKIACQVFILVSNISKLTPVFLRRNRVVTAFRQWVAPQYAPYRQASAIKSAMYLYGFNCVLRAGRSEPTTWGKASRNLFLIKSYYLYEKCSHCSLAFMSSVGDSKPALLSRPSMLSTMPKAFI